MRFVVDGGGDGVGDVEGGVGAVGDLEAQLVLSRAEVDPVVALARAEMDVVGVAGHGGAGVDEAVVDDDVEVPGAVSRLACLLDRHAVGGHLDAHAAEDGGAVRRCRQRRRRARGAVVVIAAGGETDRAEQRDDCQTAASQRVRRAHWRFPWCAGVAPALPLCRTKGPDRFSTCR
ncbi:MAG: hypothetical protein Q8K58_04815 [Acidimicrobiales bacterium]|nr:hypothetical protein [Acidimicrobiales bacterium]